MLFLGFLAMPRQGLLLRSHEPHSSARNITECSILRARLAVPGAGPVLTDRVEPRGHVLGVDALERDLAGRTQNAGVEVGAHDPTSQGLSVRLTAAQVFVGELLEGRGPLLSLNVVGRVLVRADAGEHAAGAAAGRGKLDLAMPSYKQVPAPSIDARLHDPDLTA